MARLVHEQDASCFISPSLITADNQCICTYSTVSIGTADFVCTYARLTGPPTSSMCSALYGTLIVFFTQCAVPPLTTGCWLCCGSHGSSLPTGRNTLGCFAVQVCNHVCISIVLGLRVSWPALLLLASATCLLRKACASDTL